MRLLRRFPSTGQHRASPFGPDLMGACDKFFVGTAQTFTRLPITVPFDDKGMVQLGTAPPQPDAPRVPAALELSRGQDRYDLALTRVDGRPLLIPGVLDPSGAHAEPVRLTFAVTDKGMEVAATGADGKPLTLQFDEATACAVATALLITLGVKLAKMRPVEPIVTQPGRPSSRDTHGIIE